MQLTDANEEITKISIAAACHPFCKRFLSQFNCKMFSFNFSITKLYNNLVEVETIYFNYGTRTFQECFPPKEFSISVGFNLKMKLFPDACYHLEQHLVYSHNRFYFLWLFCRGIFGFAAKFLHNLPNTFAILAIKFKLKSKLLPFLKTLATDISLSAQKHRNQKKWREKRNKKNNRKPERT